MQSKERLKRVELAQQASSALMMAIATSEDDVTLASGATDEDFKKKRAQECSAMRGRFYTMFG